MLLRSSSTPVLGSLLPSFSESPNNCHHFYHHHHPELTLNPPNKNPQIPPIQNNISFHQSPGPRNIASFSISSSPMSDTGNSFRRARSEGNLEGLSRGEEDEFCFSSALKKSQGRPSCSVLETIQSFSFCGLSCRDEHVYNNDDEEEEDYVFSHKTVVGDLNEEMQRVIDGVGVGSMEAREEAGSHVYLGRGLGVDLDFGGDNGRNFTPPSCTGGGGSGRGESRGLEEHYKKMVSDDPGNALFLQNYAQFLYQFKRDPLGVEGYYSRAILAAPNDSEILSQYAKLLWELHHHDKDRALIYSERAIEVDSRNSHVHAAYAAFLWEIEEEDEDDEVHLITDSIGC